MTKTEQDYLDLAKQNKIEFLPPMAKNVLEKSRWRCANGHEFSARFNDIQQGHGCVYCRPTARKTETDYLALAKSRSFQWIDTLPKNTATKTRWHCGKHEWMATYHDIKNGNGCPYCSKSIPLTSESYHNLAHSKLLKWIGNAVPKNNRGLTNWRCLNDHEFSQCYHEIRRGVGCPHCLDKVNGKPVSKPQRRLCELLGGELNYPVWRYRIDVALLPDKIDIEYDCAFYHDLDHDRKRDAYLIRRGWRVLRIKSAYLLPTREQLDTAITLLLSGESYTEIILDDWRD